MKAHHLQCASSIRGDGYDALPDLVMLIMEGYDRFRDGKAIHRARWMSEEGYVVDQSECRVYVKGSSMILQSQSLK